MTKLMIFIDGTWIYSNLSKLAGTAGTADLHIDYGALPLVLADRVREEMRLSDVDIVRTFFFGSYPVDYDPRDDEAVQRTKEFFALLREEFHYETELFPVSFRGNRLRKADRSPDDDFEPREKQVDIALASALIAYAAMPGSYDVALLVIGDRDYVPALQTVRRMGRRVAIASIRESCSAVYADTRDAARVKDADVIWLNDLVDSIQLRYEPRQIECQSDLHEGDRLVWTTYRPRRHQTFYCDDCRRKYLEQLSPWGNETSDAGESSAAPREGRSVTGPLGEPELPGQPGVHEGFVYSLKSEQFYGFLQARSGRQYYFNASNLRGLTWADLTPGLELRFEILREPADGRAGAVAALWRATPAAAGATGPDEQS